MHASCTRRYTHRRARMHTPKHTRVRAHTYAREHTYEPIDAIKRTTHRHTGTRMHAACARSMRSQVRAQARTHAPHERERTYKGPVVPADLRFCACFVFVRAARGVGCGRRGGARGDEYRGVSGYISGYMPVCGRNYRWHCGSPPPPPPPPLRACVPSSARSCHSTFSFPCPSTNSLMSVRGFLCGCWAEVPLLGCRAARAGWLAARAAQQPSFVKGHAVRIADPTQPASQTPLTRHGDGVHALTP